MVMKENKSSALSIILFVLLSIIWGSSFILMKEGMKILTPYQVASLRMLSAGLVLLPFGILQLKKIPKKSIPLLFLSGLIGTFFPAYLFCIAETQVDSAIAGILNALTPLFTLLTGALFFASPMPWKKWIGVTIGLVGLVLLILSGKNNVEWSNIQFAGLIVLATLLYGINLNVVGRYLKHIPSLAVVSITMALLIVPSFIILLGTHFFSSTVNQRFIHSTGASIVLGIMGTAVATLLFYRLIQQAGTVFASMVTYGIPFVAVAWGLTAGEHINLIQVGCLLVILIGVWLAKK
jgi:drug/metabolite transporter (DMT)-like permease